MIPLRRLLALSAFAAFAAAAHSQVTVYGPNAFSGTNPTAGFSSTNLPVATRTDNGETWFGDPNGFFGFGAGTQTLTLSGLQAHNSVTIAFDLYIVESMDGNGPEGPGADPWSLTQTGSTTTTLIATNFANFPGRNTQDFGGSNMSGGYLTGGSYAPRTGASAANHLGFDTSQGTNFGDSTYSLSFTFASTSTTQVFNFISALNEGNGNEGWGLDNVRVTIVPTPTPEPASFAALGVGALAILHRRRRA